MSFSNYAPSTALPVSASTQPIARFGSTRFEAAKVDQHPVASKLPAGAKDGGSKSFSSTHTSRADPSPPFQSLFAQHRQTPVPQVTRHGSAETAAPTAAATYDHVSPTQVFVDGSFKGQDKAGRCGGIGIYFGRDDLRNITEGLALDHLDATGFELMAILRALQCSRECHDIVIWSDSTAALGQVDRARESLPTVHKDGSDLGDFHRSGLASQCAENLRLREARGYKTQLKWLKGHAGSSGNIAADRMAREAREEFCTSRFPQAVTAAISSSAATAMTVDKAEEQGATLLDSLLGRLVALDAESRKRAEDLDKKVSEILLRLTTIEEAHNLVPDQSVIVSSKGAHTIETLVEVDTGTTTKPPSPVQKKLSPGQGRSVFIDTLNRAFDWLTGRSGAGNDSLDPFV